MQDKVTLFFCYIINICKKIYYKILDKTVRRGYNETIIFRKGGKDYEKSKGGIF